MQLATPFDATQVAPQESYTVLPAGVYVAQIVESEIKALASGNGSALRLTFKVLEGPCANRKVFWNLNVSHSNPQAEKIAQSQLSQLCHAIDVMRVSDTSQLHNKPVRIRVSIRKDESGKYGDQNEVKAVEKIAGVVAPNAFAPAAAPAQAPAAPAAPWQRRA